MKIIIKQLSQKEQSGPLFLKVMSSNDWNKAINWNDEMMREPQYILVYKVWRKNYKTVNVYLILLVQYKFHFTIWKQY